MAPDISVAYFVVKFMAIDKAANCMNPNPEREVLKCGRRCEADGK